MAKNGGVRITASTFTNTTGAIHLSIPGAESPGLLFNEIAQH